MALTLQLRTEEEQISAYLGDLCLAGPTAIDSLPAAADLRGNAFQVYEHGKELFEALGGSALVKHLDKDDGVLLLQADDKADAIPWEYALQETRELLACDYGMLRLVAGEAGAPVSNGPLQFIALGADPLVDAKGRPREGYRLDIDNELAAIAQTLRSSGNEVVGKRIPPTKRALRQALRRGPALLHLTCHGNIVHTAKAGPMAMLYLEDATGAEDPLQGRKLMQMPPKGVLRLVVLSACHTASGDQARLARTLVQNGVPAAIGIQGAYPDPLSDELAVPLYDSLLLGFSLAEAMRQTRQVLGDVDIASAGLPVVYVANNGWQGLEIREGASFVPNLKRPGVAQLAPEIQPPRPLLGRSKTLHDLAARYEQGAHVVTIVGSGGLGKTALAAAFAERFAWRWSQGVLGISFAGEEPDAGQFRQSLLRALIGPDIAASLAEAAEGSVDEVLLQALSDWKGLLLLDNYESVLQYLPEHNESPPTEETLTSTTQAEIVQEANAIQRLIYLIAEGGGDLLLTSRRHPAGLPGEKTFPHKRSLQGIGRMPAVQLFFRHSSSANPDATEHVRLAEEIARATEGHPLAIALLAGEFDESDITTEAFLASWPEELAAARRSGLAEHHVTFAVAFSRSYERLSASMQAKLRALSMFSFPFFAEAATLVWGLSTAEEQPDADAARGDLGRFVRATLLDVDATFSGSDRPATYRFLPVIWQEVAGRLGSRERLELESGFAAYGAWLASRGYLDIHSDAGLARLVRQSMPALERATGILHDTEQLWHIRRLAWLKNAFGETSSAYELLNNSISDVLPDPESEREMAEVQSSLRHELANVCVTRGDLDRALALYEESLQIKEQIGDLQGKAASLHQMAAVFLTRGHLDRALALYEESLQILEQIGDLKGKAASLSNMANLFMQQRDWTAAERVLEESLAIARQLQQPDGVAFSIVKLGQVAEALDDKETALTYYRQGLTTFEQLGMSSESSQVRNMIANLGGGGDLEAQLAELPSEQRLAVEAAMQRAAQLRQHVEQARQAAANEDYLDAVSAQEQATALAREFGEEQEALVQLSVLLYNLSSYYQKAGRFVDAVKALEEVVALDERTGHPDLESDRQALVQARQMATLSPEQRRQMETAAEELANLSPEQQAEMEAALRQMAEMDPEQLASLQAQAIVGQIQQTADQTRDAAIAALRGEVDTNELVVQMDDVATRAAEDESPGSPWLEVALFVQAAAALLRGDPIPPVPDIYVDHMAAIRREQN